MNRGVSIVIDEKGRKTVLKGSNLKAKANITQAVGELIQIATNKSSAEDYGEKHGKRAKFGWYRYDTRLALPVYNTISIYSKTNE